MHSFNPSQSALLSRRDFLLLSALASAGMLSGCAANPVTGQRQLMLMSKEQEISIDQEHSPHQLSADYGPVQDQELNSYIQDIGQDLAQQTHRPDMPYSFQGVNAVYVNAYAFPGGSIAVTRGILLELQNEAELAALLGHELGHVNARHTASHMSKGMLASAVLAGTGAVLADNKEYAPLISGLGGIGAGALLAKYSRDNERQADALGMEYMVHNRYNPEGMVGLMDVLRQKSQQDPNLVQIMFSTHPMSDERYQTARQRARQEYAQANDLPLQKERYLDHTASLRRKEKLIQELQKAEKLMQEGKFSQAEEHLLAGLDQDEQDYAGLVILSKCLRAQDKDEQARKAAQKAREVYPQEPQAVLQSSLAALDMDKHHIAYQELETYEQMLPGNPQTLFYRGLAMEGMQRKKQAADFYLRFLRQGGQGKQGEYALNKLQKWGYIQE
ncbi:MAG: M48 family metalloprotease [Thermodesulfobacteriota bacterium]